MGALQAQAMAEATDVRTGLYWHLTANHYPPLPGAWVDGAVEAIDAWNDGEPERIITLPEAGRFAEQAYTAEDLVDRMHLHAWL